jgi:hypothetical protein
MNIITSLADIVKEIVMAIYDVDRITDISFLQWFVTFVVVYVVIRAYMYVVDED